MNKITEVRFVKYMGRTDVQGIINGKAVDLFSYYEDELYFVDHDLIGLTEDQARDLFRTRDIAYLQS